MAIPCLVTGTLQTMSGGKIAQGTVIFQLANVGNGIVPRIIGTGEFPMLKYTLMTDQNGVINGVLWGNDSIDPQNTIYLVTFRDYLGNEFGPIQYFINGANFNLNMATPIVNLSLPIYSSLGFATGTPLAFGNFLFSGWGAGATISGISGTQMGCIFTMTAGTTPSVQPTVTLTFPGPFPRNPMTLAQMIGGTGGIADISVAPVTTQVIFTYDDLPEAGKTYQIAAFTLGL